MPRPGAPTQVRVTHALDRWLFNPLFRGGVRSGLAPRAFALLETTGRRTGRKRVVPVGNGLDSDTFWIVAQDGYDCAYVRNLEADPHVRVRVPRGGGWRSGTASVVLGDDSAATRRRIDKANGWSGAFDGVIFRSVCTELVTIRVDLDP